MSYRKELALTQSALRLADIRIGDLETQLAAEKESHRLSIEVINLAWNSYVKADEATRIGMVPVKASGFQALPVRSCGSCGHPSDNHPYRHIFVEPLQGHLVAGGAISQGGTKWVDDGSLYGKRVPVTDPE